MYGAVVDPENQGGLPSMATTSREANRGRSKVGLLVAVAIAAMGLVVLVTSPSSPVQNMFLTLEEVDEDKGSKNSNPVGVPGKHALLKRPREVDGVDIEELFAEPEQGEVGQHGLEKRPRDVTASIQSPPLPVSNEDLTGSKPTPSPFFPSVPPTLIVEEAMPNADLTGNKPTPSPFFPSVPPTLIIDEPVSPWKEYTDSASGRVYWYNKETKVSTWERPDQELEQLAAKEVKTVDETEPELECLAANAECTEDADCCDTDCNHEGICKNREDEELAAKEEEEVECLAANAECTEDADCCDTDCNHEGICKNREDEELAAKEEEEVECLAANAECTEDADCCDTDCNHEGICKNREDEELAAAKEEEVECLAANAECTEDADCCDTDCNHEGICKNREDLWVQYTDRNSGKVFWYNKETKESSWTKPEGI